MPFIVNPMLAANERFAALSAFDPADLLGAIGDATSIVEAMANLDLVTPALDNPTWVAEFTDFVESIPPSLDAAVLAAVRSALEREVRVQFNWRPAAGIEVELFESSDGSAGLLAVEIRSPEPPETHPDDLA